MTHFLRRNGKTVVDVEVSKDDLQVVVCIKEYSRLLLDTHPERQAELIADFGSIQELRGTWFEMTPRPILTKPNEFVAMRLLAMVDKWQLNYVTD